MDPPLWLCAPGASPFMPPTRRYKQRPARSVDYQQGSQPAGSQQSRCGRREGLDGGPLGNRRGRLPGPRPLDRADGRVRSAARAAGQARRLAPAPVCRGGEIAEMLFIELVLPTWSPREFGVEEVV